MRLSISNIAWDGSLDKEVCLKMAEMGFEGMEIAPTRLFGLSPYDRIDEAVNWQGQLAGAYGITVSSIQSIWHGRDEQLFRSKKEREALQDYTIKCIDFAAAVKCRNIVFGCPKNRIIPENFNKETGAGFFREIGAYATEKGTVIAIEATPAIYGGNYIMNTMEAADLVEYAGSDGIKLNLDIGTMIENKEEPDMLKGIFPLIHHVHISEPNLKKICKRKTHKVVADILSEIGYKGFVSIEMGRLENMDDIIEVMGYVKNVFCGC